MESNLTKTNPSETELWNCEHAFEFICPCQWVSLKETESPGIRYCETCNQKVYLCGTPSEFVRQGNLGRCVAIHPEGVPRAVYTNYDIMGRPSTKWLKEMAEKYERERKWWQGVSEFNPGFNKEAVAEIRRRCRLLK